MTVARQPYSPGRMGIQGVLGETEARNFDKWAADLTTQVNAMASLLSGGLLPVITSVNDADITVTQDHDVLQWDALTATRTATLPPFADTPEGKAYTFRDNTGLATNLIRINIVPDAADTGSGVGIDGLAAYPITLGRGFVTIIRGATRWNLDGERLMTRIYNAQVLNPNATPGASASFQAIALPGAGYAYLRLTSFGVKNFDWAHQLSTGSLLLFEGSDVAVRVLNTSFVLGPSSLAPTAVDGFLYVRETTGGPPSVTPTTYSGRAPIVIDPTNKRLHAYVNSTAWESLPMRCLNVQTADVSNTNPGLFTDETLHTFSLPAGVLANNGESIEAEYAFTSIGDVDPAGCGVYFGATRITPNVQVPQAGGDTVIKVRIFRTGATTQRAYSTFQTSVSAWSTVSSDYTTPAETLANSIVLRSYGYVETIAGVVTCKLSSVRWIPRGV